MPYMVTDQVTHVREVYAYYGQQRTEEDCKQRMRVRAGIKPLKDRVMNTGGQSGCHVLW